MLLCVHHIATDGWSQDVLLSDLTKLYHQIQLDPLTLQYPDFANWQNGWLQGPILEEQVRYWQEELKGDLPVLRLPSDRPRSPIMTHQGAIFSFELPTELVQRARSVASQMGTTLFSYMLSSFIGTLYLFSGQEDIIVGIPTSGRISVDLAQVVGYFINTVAIRTDLSDRPNFVELSKRVHAVILRAQENQDLPFERLVNMLKIQRNLSTTPVFQVMFAWQPRSHFLNTDPATAPLEGKLPPALYNLKSHSS